MREILFRGKREDNGIWVEGFYCQNKIRHHKEGRRTEVIRHIIIVDADNRGYRCMMIDPETLCQYTGLTDKDGRKIFEGDIVELFDRNNDYTWRAKVEFGNPNGKYNWGWQLKPIGECEANTDILLWIGMEDAGASCTVIGNCFDNPEFGK